MTVYHDYPDCLTRYQWLLDAGDNAYDCQSCCKACGEQVPRQSWVRHLKGHRQELAKMKQRTQRENTARLRSVNRLRREAQA